MKKINLLFVLIFIITITISCNEYNYQSEISKRLYAHFKNDLKNYDMIVILPGSGCTGCITNAEDFFIKNVQNNDKIKFILTYNNSIKNLTLKLGKENIYLPNTFIDKNNSFYLSAFEERMYPMAAILDNGKVTKIIRLDLHI